MADLRLTQRRTGASVSGIVLVVFFALCWTIPFFYSLILSLKSYSPMRGLFGSPWVGLANYREIFGQAQAGQLWLNSFLLRMTELGSALAVGIPLALAVSSIRGERSRLWAAALCLLPSLIPETSWVYLLREALPAEAFLEQSRFLSTYALLSAIGGGGAVAFAGGLFSALKQRGAGGGLWAGVAAFACLALFGVFSPSQSALLLLQSPMNYALSDTLSTYVYRRGLIGAEFSKSAVFSCLRMLAQLPIAALAALPLARLLRSAPEDTPAKQARELAPKPGLLRLPAGLLIALALVLWLGVLAAPLFGSQALGALKELWANDTLREAVENSAGVAALAFAVALPIWALLLWALRAVRARGFAAFAAVATAFSGATVALYLLARGAGLVNTRYAAALGAVFAPQAVLLALLMSAAGLRAGGLRVIWAALFAALIAAAFAWGDYYAPLIYLSDRSLYPLGLTLREVARGAQSASESLPEGYAAVSSALCGAPCLILGALAALCCCRALGRRPEKVQ